MPSTTRLFLAALTMTILTACGGSDQGSDPGSTPDTSSTPTESAETAEGCETPSDADGDTLTQPGSQLCVGSAALLPFRNAEEGLGTYRMTVESIEALPTEDFEAAVADGLLHGYPDEESRADERTLWTVRGSSTLVSVDEGHADNLDAFPFGSGLMTRDDTTNAFMGSPDFCSPGSFEDGAQPGDTVPSCMWFLVDSDDEVQGFTPLVFGDTDELGAYDPIVGEPVSWTVD